MRIWLCVSLCLFLELLNHPMSSFPALPLPTWVVSSSASCRHRWYSCCCRGFSSSIIIRLRPSWVMVSFFSHTVFSICFLCCRCRFVDGNWTLGVLCGLSWELRNHYPLPSFALRGMVWHGFSICTVLWVSVCCFWQFVVLYMIIDFWEGSGDVGQAVWLSYFFAQDLSPVVAYLWNCWWLVAYGASYDVSDHASNGWSYVGWVLSWCAVMRFRLGGSASVSLKEGEVHLFWCERGLYTISILSPASVSMGLISSVFLSLSAALMVLLFLVLFEDSQCAMCFTWRGFSELLLRKWHWVSEWVSESGRDLDSALCFSEVMKGVIHIIAFA